MTSVVTHAQAADSQTIAEARRAAKRGDELFALGRDAAAIEHYHEALITLGANVPKKPFANVDVRMHYNGVRAKDLKDVVLGGDLFGRIAETYLHSVVGRGPQVAPTPAPLSVVNRRRHGMAATHASIRLLEKALDEFRDRAELSLLYERRNAGRLLRRAYDLDILTTLEIAYVSGMNEALLFTFSKILRSRSITFLEALWVRRLAFTRVATKDHPVVLSKDALRLVDRWGSTHLLLSYLREAYLSEKHDIQPRTDLLKDLRRNITTVESKLAVLSKLALGTITSHEMKESLRLYWYPRNDLGAGFLAFPRLKSSFLLIQFHETPRKVFAFTFDPAIPSPFDRVRVFPLQIDPETLRQDVDDFRDELKKRSPDWRSKASGLYRDLFGRLAPYMRGRDQIYIVPSGSLNKLPFQALIDPIDNRRRRFVVLPHAELLGPFLAPPALRNARARVLAVGINQFNGQEDLKYAESEARGIKSLFGDKATLLLGSRGETGKKNVLSQIPHHGVIHIASHASFDRRAMNSTIIVRGNGSYDERITGFDMIDPGIKLDGALITLSACETGRMATDRGEDPLGLISALMIAGAETVIASHWSVNDPATKLLMVRFYEGLADGESAEQALAHATNELMKKPEYAHPYYWAPFVLYGNGDWRFPR